MTVEATSTTERTIRAKRIPASALTTVLLAAAATAGFAQERPQRRPAAEGERGWIGIVYDLHYAPHRTWPTPSDSAVLVIQDVQERSPAARVGLQAGDTVLRINGVPVTAQGMQRFGQALRPGARVRFTVRRDGRTRDVLVVADRRSESVFFYPQKGGEHTIMIRMDSVREAILRSLDSVRANLEAVRFDTTAFARLARDAARLSVFYTDSLVPRVELHFRRLPQEQARADSAIAELRRRQGLRAQELRRMRRAADSMAAEARRAQEQLTGARVAELRRQRLLVDSVLQAAERARAQALALEAAPLFAPSIVGQRVVAGAQLTALNPELAAYFGVARGVLVTEVLEGTPAADAGLAAGDVITATADRPVASIPEFRAALARAERPATITVVRKGRTLKLKLPE